jgi:hypothetical protein
MYLQEVTVVPAEGDQRSNGIRAVRNANRKIGVFKAAVLMKIAYHWLLKSIWLNVANGDRHHYPRHDLCGASGYRRHAGFIQ